MDRTGDARFRSLDPKVATVTPAGVVHAVGNGQTTIVVEIDGHVHNVAVTAVDATVAAAVQFRERRRAGFEPVRLQLRRLSRQGRGTKRLQIVGIRLRPRGRLRRPGQGGPRPARLPRFAGITVLSSAKFPASIAHGGGVRFAGRLRRLRDAARPGSRPAPRSACRPIPRRWPCASSRASAC